MWRCGSTKQRVRLGPSRHLRGSGRRYTNTHAHCYSDRDCHCHRYCHCDGDRYRDNQPYCHSIGNGHAATDANTKGGAIGTAAPNAFPTAVERLEAISDKLSTGR